MPNNQQPEDDGFDAFAEPGLSVDLTGFSPEQQRAYRQQMGLPEPTPEDTGWGSLAPHDDRDARDREFRKMLADPEVWREMAQQDPRWSAKFRAELAEQVVTQFRLKHPEFKPGPLNRGKLVQHLAKQHLGKDWLDHDAATEELITAGRWSLENLEQAYAELSAQGALRVRRGTARRLTPREQLEIIALAQGQSPEMAAVRYMQTALQEPYALMYATDETVAEFRAEHVNLNNEAIVFVYRSIVNVNDDEWDDFARTSLSSPGLLLSFDSLNRMFSRWQQERADEVQRIRSAPKPPTSAELDEMTDEEITNLYQRSRTEAYRKSA